MDKNKSEPLWSPPPGVFPALVVSSAVLAFFFQPVVRFVSFPDVYAGLIMAGLGVVLAAAGNSRRLWVGLALGCFATWGGAYYVMNGLDRATEAMRVNDARCANIQREMLTSKPRRPDLPDLFNALGCRPQLQDDVQFPK